MIRHLNFIRNRKEPWCVMWYGKKHDYTRETRFRYDFHLISSHLINMYKWHARLLLRCTEFVFAKNDFRLVYVMSIRGIGFLRKWKLTKSPHNTFVTKRNASIHQIFARFYPQHKTQSARVRIPLIPNCWRNEYTGREFTKQHLNSSIPLNRASMTNIFLPMFDLYVLLVKSENVQLNRNTNDSIESSTHP